MQENSNLNRKGKSNRPCQDNMIKAETIPNGATYQQGKLKDEKINLSTSKREDAIDVLTYMSFKL